MVLMNAGQNMRRRSAKFRDTLYPIVDEIQKADPSLSLEQLAEKVKEKTGTGCMATIQTRYIHNRRLMCKTKLNIKQMEALKMKFKEPDPASLRY